MKQCFGKDSSTIHNNAVCAALIDDKEKDFYSDSLEKQLKLTMLQLSQHLYMYHSL